MPRESPCIVVVGGSGFVGRWVISALDDLGVAAKSLSAPRLVGGDVNARTARVAHDDLSHALAGADAVINAAGVSDATGRDEDLLMGANAVLPGLLAQVTASSGARLVHVSSAAVQGRAPLLDASMRTESFSPYSHSKAEGERAVLRYGGRAVIYRPPGVHSAERAVSRAIARLARSKLSSVAAPGTASSPQALAPNVGAAVAYLATCSAEPPAIVIHPSEGVTTKSLLADLGGKDPLQIPAPIARLVVRGAQTLGGRSALIAANARRLEMMWSGQEQDESWLTQQGWRPPIGREGWRQMGTDIRARSEGERGE